MPTVRCPTGKSLAVAAVLWLHWNTHDWCYHSFRAFKRYRDVIQKFRKNPLA